MPIRPLPAAGTPSAIFAWAGILSPDVFPDLRLGSLMASVNNKGATARHDNG